jgi:hypothetical protein
VSPVFAVQPKVSIKTFAVSADNVVRFIFDNTYYFIANILLAVVYFLITGELGKSEQRFREVLTDYLPEERFIKDETQKQNPL